MKQNKQACLHCPGGYALKNYLFVDDDFWIVCDVHPLIEGHIEVIPKKHISCMGALDDAAFDRYKELYKKVTDFLAKTYGDFGVFEHGITGQTVFHAHVHFLPFNKTVDDVVPEKELIKTISNLDELRHALKKDGKYLFFSIGDNKFLVDTKIGQPRFFRDRFADALGAGERGNWKETEKNEELMKTFDDEVKSLKNKWNKFFANKKGV